MTTPIHTNHIILYARMNSYSLYPRMNNYYFISDHLHCLLQETALNSTCKGYFFCLMPVKDQIRQKDNPMAGPGKPEAIPVRLIFPLK